MERSVQKIDADGQVVATYGSALRAMMVTGDFDIVNCLDGRQASSQGAVWRYSDQAAPTATVPSVKRPFKRLLHFALITRASPQLGLRKAIRGLAEDGREFSWIPYYEGSSLGKMRAEFSRIVADYKPDVIFMQIQTPGIVTAGMLDKSDAFKMQWNGDLRDDLPQHSVEVAKLVDLSLFSNMRDVESLKELGHASEYLNIGFSENIFMPEGDNREGTADIVFLGNNYGNRFPRSDYRMKLVAHLRKRYGKQFAVHGSGWGIDEPWLCEMEEASAYRSCKIALSCEHFAVSRFSSDRILRATGSGAFMLSDGYPGIELDFQVGGEVETWTDLTGLANKIDYYLEDHAKRQEIAEAGCRRAHATHRWTNRVAQLAGIIKEQLAKKESVAA